MDRSQLTPHRRFSTSGITFAAASPRAGAVLDPEAAARVAVQQASSRIWDQRDPTSLRDALAAAAYVLGQQVAAKLLPLEPCRDHLWRIGLLRGIPQLEAERIVKASIERARRRGPPAKPRHAGLKPPWTSATRPHSPGRPKGSKNRKPRSRR